MRRIYPKFAFVGLALALLSSEALADEQLAMPKFPAGWTEAFSRQGDQEVVEYVPPGQTAANWQKKITLEVYRDFKNLPLDTFQRRAAQQNRDACTGVKEGKFQSGVNNGYPSAFWTLGCERNKTSGFGEIRYTKAIQGKGALYILSELWRTPAYGKQGPNVPQAEFDGAVGFLTSSVVCEAGSEASPCPK